MPKKKEEPKVEKIVDVPAVSIVGTTYNQDVQKSTKLPQIKKIPDYEIPSVGTKKESTKEIYIKALGQRNLDDIVPYIQGLSMATSRIDWWDPLEIIEAMILSESRGKNRANVLKYLQAAERARHPIGLSNADFDPAVHTKGTFFPKYKPKKFGK